jgi:uncharacterized protein
MATANRKLPLEKVARGKVLAGIRKEIAKVHAIKAKGQGTDTHLKVNYHLKGKLAQKMAPWFSAQIEKIVTARLDSVVLKVAARCNLNCSYCYVYNHEDSSFAKQPKFISREVVKALLDRMLEYSASREGHQWSISLHGGEPTLLGKTRLSWLIAETRSRLDQSLSAIYMQTNATLIDSDWARWIVDNGVSVSVSLDGDRAAHDRFRVDHRGNGSYERVIDGIRALQMAGVDVHVLCVVNPWVSGRNVYEGIRKLDVTQLDFLLPDVSHDNKHRFFGQLPALSVGNFLIEVFNAWIEEDNPKVEIRLFRDLLFRIHGVGNFTEQFSGGQANYIVCETDGSIEPNDSLRVCADGITKTGLHVFRDNFDDIGKYDSLLDIAVNSGHSLPRDCMTCKQREICNGGYLPQRFSKEREFDNASVWCQDLYLLIDHLRSAIPLGIEPRNSRPFGRRGIAKRLRISQKTNWVTLPVGPAKRRPNVSAGRPTRPVVLFANALGDHLLALPTMRALNHILAPNLRYLGLPDSAPTFFRDIRFADVLTLKGTYVDKERRDFDVEAAASDIGECDLVVSPLSYSSDSIRSLLDRLRPARSIGFLPYFSEYVQPARKMHEFDLAFQIPLHLEPRLCIDTFASPPSAPFLRAVGRAKGKHKLLVIHSDTKPEKTWPWDRFARVLNRFFTVRRNFVGILIGMPNAATDPSLVSPNVVPCLGKSLADTLGLIRHADLFIGIDSCFLHAADLFRVPGIGLFGPTSPKEFGWRFTRNLHLKGRSRMSDISYERVLSALLDLSNGI